MALIKCSECGNNVSTMATSCPSCGCPLSLVVPENLELTQGVGGMELNANLQDTFSFCVEAGGKFSQKHIPKFNVMVDQGVILLESVDTHGGWFDPVLYRDRIFIKPVAVNSNLTLITNFHYEPATRQDVSQKVWIGFLDELYFIITK